jgi:xanthine dehydrogenase YagT iron-sulfur-binding subunit
MSEGMSLPSPDDPSPPSSHTDPHTGARGVSRRSFLKRMGATGLASMAPAFVSRPVPASPSSSPMSSDLVAVRLKINDAPHSFLVEPRAVLLDVLRDKLGLTGTKKGCDHGQCGACTVLVDGRRVLSCLTLAATQHGATVTTIEGLEKNGELHPVQQAFLDHDAFQCGYCTSGQIMSAVGLLHEPIARDDAAVREAMSGNICRCGAYHNILAAVKTARASA